MYMYVYVYICIYIYIYIWHGGSVMDCQVTVRGSIAGGNGVFTELHVLRKGQ